MVLMALRVARVQRKRMGHRSARGKDVNNSDVLAIVKVLNFEGGTLGECNCAVCFEDVIIGMKKVANHVDAMTDASSFGDEFRDVQTVLNCVKDTRDKGSIQFGNKGGLQNVEMGKALEGRMRMKRIPCSPALTSAALTRPRACNLGRAAASRSSPALTSGALPRPRACNLG